MAITRVRDEQLKLDDVDQNVKLKGTENLRLENIEPSVVLRETDQVLPAGLWRAKLTGDQILFSRNTAAVGDFSSADHFLALEGALGVARFRKSVTLESSLVLRFEGETHIQTRPTTAAPTPTSSFRTIFVDNPIVDTVERSRLRVGNPALVQGGAVRDVTFQTDFLVREIPTGAIDGVNVTFTLSQLPVFNKEMVFLNGLLQSAGAEEDYTIVSKTITFSTAPSTGDKIRVSYMTTT